MSVVLAVFQTVFQACWFVFCVPLVGWVLEALPRWINGEAVAGPVFRRDVWRRSVRGRMSSGLALGAMAALVSALVLPGVTVREGLVSLASPLLVGILLVGGRLVVGVPLWREEIWRVVSAILLICLAEALVALAAPGADGLGGLCVLLRVEPVPGLEGALVACALALAIACPPLGEDEILARLVGERVRTVREEVRAVAGLLNAAWVFFLADLAFPVTVGLGGDGLAGWMLGVAGLVLRLGMVLGVLVILRLVVEGHRERLTALFAGVALLLALAGRFAT